MDMTRCPYCTPQSLHSRSSASAPSPQSPCWWRLRNIPRDMSFAARAAWAAGLISIVPRGNCDMDDNLQADNADFERKSGLRATLVVAQAASVIADGLAGKSQHCQPQVIYLGGAGVALSEAT